MIRHNNSNSFIKCSTKNTIKKTGWKLIQPTSFQKYTNFLHKKEGALNAPNSSLK